MLWRGENINPQFIKVKLMIRREIYIFVSAFAQWSEKRKRMSLKIFFEELIYHLKVFNLNERIVVLENFSAKLMS